MSRSSAAIAVATRVPDAVVRHQRATARLVASEAVKLQIDVVHDAVEVLDDSQRDGDLLLGGAWQVQRGELLARVAALQAPQAVILRIRWRAFLSAAWR